MKSREKFSFNIGFQLEVLRYLIQGKDSLLIVPKVKSEYFTLIEHAIIMKSLSKYVRKYSKIPGSSLLKEGCYELLGKKEYADLVTKDDIPNIESCIDNLYDIPLRDMEAVRETIYQFSAYVEMKALNERMDFTNFNLYGEYQAKISKIIQNSKPATEDSPLMMVEDTSRRQLLRKVDPDVVPTPYWQLNNLSNGNGYSKGSIFVLLDKPKARKTFSLINISRGYLSMKKNVLYIDTENGKAQIMERMIQSTLNKTKLEMLSGDFDKAEQRHMKKYKRLGVEFIVERVPALVGDVNSIRGIIQKIKLDKGIDIQVLVVDYAAKLASLARDKEDISRINNVYIELDNLAHELGLEAIWTAQHVTREAAKHKATRYEDNDIASSISIVRNAQCVIGLNSTEEEEAHNIQRMEVVVQRDGKPYGRCLFNVNLDTQRWKEFSKKARETYDSTQGKEVDRMIKKDISKERKNPYSNKEKAEKVKDI